MPHTTDVAPLIFVVVVLAVIAHYLWHKHDRLMALIPAVIAFVLVWQNFPASHRGLNALRHAAGLGSTALAPAATAVLYLVIVLIGVKIMFAGSKHKRKHGKSSR